MPARTFPNIGLKAGYAAHESGWGDDMTLNMLKLSVLAQGRVINKVAAEPGSPAANDTYILDETHATHPNEIAVYDNGAWVYFGTSLRGWRMWNITTNAYLEFNGTIWTAPSQTNRFELVVAVSDESTALAVGTNKIKFRMPRSVTVTEVRASLNVAQTSGSIFTVDINESGVSILSTKLTIDNGEKTSTTAATPAVVTDTALADDAEMSVDIDQIGDGTAVGLKIMIIGTSN